MIPSIGFILVPSISFSLPSYQTDISKNAFSVIHCGKACAECQQCGGFYWNQLESPPCKLVVEASVAGAVADDIASGSKVFRLTNFDGGKLIEIHRSLDPANQMASHSMAREVCSSYRSSMLKFPLSEKARASIQIRMQLWVHIDLQRDSGSATTWYNSEGQEFETSDPLLTWDNGQPVNQASGLIALIKGQMKFHDTSNYHALEASLMCFQD